MMSSGGLNLGGDFVDVVDDVVVIEILALVDLAAVFSLRMLLSSAALLPLWHHRQLAFPVVYCWLIAQSTLLPAVVGECHVS